MMAFSQQAVNSPTFCSLCSNIGNSRCGRCRSVFYCSRQHQIQHWPVHKKVCKTSEQLKAQSTSLLISTNNTNVPIGNFSTYTGGDEWCQNNLPMNVMSQPSNLFDTGVCNTAPTEKLMDFQFPSVSSYELPTDEEIYSTLSNELLSFDNNFWELINKYTAQNLLEMGTYLDKDNDGSVPKVLEASTSGSSNQTLCEEALNLMGGVSVQDICTNVVFDLNKYGICVLDRFVGSQLGSLILDEVKNLYQQGIFKNGELVVQNPCLAKENIRSDVTTWVDGTEPECVNIGHLMRVLDVVITTCNKLKDSGVLSQYKLHRRTRAMIACYPGDGTHYKKHIDNPHKDGRCITCIYYLNQNWDIQQHGGLLQMFPSVLETEVAQIEPLFDRMIFFWSDKRNPHEVLPSLATRFAITVWYFDSDERDEALSRKLAETKL